MSGHSHGHQDDQGFEPGEGRIAAGRAGRLLNLPGW